MENNKREWPPVRRPRRRGINVRPIALLLALVLLIGGTVGGVIAWFIDITAPVQNTFSVGNIDITLSETFNTDSNSDNDADKWVGKMVPGAELPKDPKVTVTGGSEACWLFVKVEKKGKAVVDTTEKVFDDFISYELADNWIELEGQSGIYYRQVTASDADQEFAVLKDNKVTVKSGVTKGMMDALGTDSAEQLSLTFTAYAIQQANLTDQNSDSIVDAKDAWELIST